MQDGIIPFPYRGETFQTYYKVIGDLGARTHHIPIVALHGGPGFSHDYLIPHADLAGDGTPVIFYDQIGNARSSHLPDKPLSFWTIDLFLDELVNLLEHFDIHEYHIVGHSWGGMMAAEFVVRRHPKGLKRLVIADSPSAVALWRQSFHDILQDYPQWVRDALARDPAEDRETYWKAMMEVHSEHGCRAKPFPQPLIDTFMYKYGENADRTLDKADMLKGWSIEDRLHLVDVPTLVLNGRYDIAQDWVTKAYSEKIPNSTWVKFEDSSHTPFWEEKEKYMQVLGDFFTG